MIGISEVLGFLFIFSMLAYQRANLIIWTIALGFYLLVITPYHALTPGVIAAWSSYLVIFSVLNIKKIRRFVFTQAVFKFYRRIMPSMSATEREAIAAGTVTWEGELFTGMPNWRKLLAQPAPKLTEEEQDFMNGPVEKLCSMICDWEITHTYCDIPPHIWQYIKEQGFWGLIIPKIYGGKEFSAYAHSQILSKIGGRSITVSSTIAVPNSLGPAELLLHYGTEEQKKYYLPRLATGEEIPCFALTSPEAGSDAGSMSDHGIIAWGEIDGEKTLGIRLNWDKRYITLAPIATLVGLAFKLYDPDHLLGEKADIGITCALIPRNTPGITIGRRHFPMSTPFQNGPIQGKDVFIPLSWIIGGVKQAGKGWRMLMECLAAGRAISLPAGVLGGSKALSYATGAYARIRRQFNLPIGRFEGVEEPLARLSAFTYLMDAARTLAVMSIDAGEKPAVASAIVKCHVTELSRIVVRDCLDIHGGKGICLGPKNYNIARSYEAAPIAITVEGANILTRNMIIFGQGAMRCHPYVLPELEAARIRNEHDALVAFDRVVIKHIAFGLSNTVRTWLLALTGSRLVSVPRRVTKRYFQHATRFSSAFAMITDVSMLVLGGALKRKESLSARLGDILSFLYILSATLKHFEDQGSHTEDLPLVNYVAQFCLYEIQQRFDEILRNFPSRILATILRFIIFPLGKRFARPRDSYSHKIATLMMAPTSTRERVAVGAYLTPSEENRIADIQDALLKAIASEPIEKLIRQAKRDDKVSGYTFLEQAKSALENAIITHSQFETFMQADIARKKVIAVDDFAADELVRHMANAVTKTETSQLYRQGAA